MTSSKKIHIKWQVKWALGIGLGLLMAFLLERYIRYRPVGLVSIQVYNQENNYFLDSSMVYKIMDEAGPVKLNKATHADISLSGLENKIEENLFVKECEIARNLQGDVFVEVALSKPIARFVRADRADFYIDSLGKIMPAVDWYTARVPLVAWEKDSISPDFQREDRDLLAFLNEVHAKPFWRSEISEVFLDKNRMATLYLQAGAHRVILGKLTNFRDKLEKLWTFYMEILPVKGWNAYKTISLQYDNQIICE